MISGETELKLMFFIDLKENSYIVTVLLNNNLIMTIKDESLNNNTDLTHFKTTVNEDNKSQVFLFKQGKVIFNIYNVETNYIKPIKKDLINLENRKILTLDLETRMSKISGGSGKDYSCPAGRE
jgi:hypothetical protein